MKRNRSGVLAAGVIATALMLGVIGTTGGMLWALSERKTAIDARESESKAKVQAEMSAAAAINEAQRAEVAEAETAETLQEVDRQRKAAEAASTEAREAEERSRVLRYATDIQLASTLLENEDTNANQILLRLDDYSPHLNPKMANKRDLRGFEWYYLRQKAEGLGSLLLTFEEPIVDVAFDPQGLLVTVDQRGEIKRWNAETLDLQASQKIALVRDASRVVLSPDCARLALAVNDDVFMIDALSGNRHGVIAAQTRAGLQFSSNGEMLVTVDTDAAWWNSENCEFIGSRDFGFETEGIFPGHIDLSSDGLTLAVGGQGEMKDDFYVLQLEPEYKQVEQLQFFNAGNGTKQLVALCPDDRTLWTSLKLGRSVHRYEIENGNFLGTVGPFTPSPVSALYFGKDSKELIVGSLDGTIRVLSEFHNGGTVTGISLLGHTAAIVDLHVDANENRLASLDADNQIRIWDLKRGPVAYRNVSAYGYRTHVSPDGLLLAASDSIFSREGTDVLSLRDGFTGEPVAQFTRADQELSTWSVAFSPDGHYLAAGLGGFNPNRIRIELWDIDGRNLVGELELNEVIPEFIASNQRGGCFAMSFSPNGRYLVAGLSHAASSVGERGEWPLAGV
ncbi:WD40 repeat domain-containing protein [Planctomycetaceae bacterium SH139]